MNDALAPPWMPSGLPPGLRISVRRTLELARPGPGGTATVWVAELLAGTARVTLLVQYRPKVLARDLRALRDLLSDAEIVWRSSIAGGAPLAAVPTLATDVATPGLMEAASQNGLAVIDRRGTVVVEHGPVFIHVKGTGRIARQPRRPAFSGKSARLMRWLLAQPFGATTAQAMATRARISYVYAHNVLVGLEEAGYVGRLSPRSGFLLRNPTGLLREWVAYATEHPPAMQGFYAPSVTPDALHAGDAARREAGLDGAFTLASALLPDEVHAAALPHGMYLSGDPQPVIAALRLRRTTPFNFFLLRPDEAADTAAGGVYLLPRALPYGRGVAAPQLCADFAGIGGRGLEQSEFLMESYASMLLAPRSA